MGTSPLVEQVLELGMAVRDRPRNPATMAEFATLVSSASLRDLLCDLLVRPGNLKELSTRGHVHPNSFVKIPLVEASNVSKLVIHRWIDDPKSDPDIHNHRWNFLSTVLTGCLVASNFGATIDDDGQYLEYRYQSTSALGEYRLEPVARAHLAASKQVTIAEDSWYAQDHRVIHGAGTGAPGTVTLIIQGSSSSPTCRVFRPLSARAEPQPIVAPSPAEVSQTVEQLIAMLED